MRCYLTDRTQLVKLSSTTSRAVAVPSGVVQGSHLGPLLFSLYINDLCEQIEGCSVLLYADDIKLYRKICGPGDCLSLQKELDTILRWCDQNNMSLNVNKCEAISFKRNETNILSYDYHCRNQVLKRVTVVKDLGVLLDSRLTFKTHIDHVVSKSKATLYLVKVLAKNYECPYVTKQLYVSLVRPIAEYCSIVWSPYLVGDIARLESIQKQFLLFALRQLPWSHQYIRPSYESRLMLLDMDSLEERRKLATVCFVHRCLSGNVKVSSIVEKFQQSVPARNTRAAAVFSLSVTDLSGPQYVENAPLRRFIKVFNEFSVDYEPGISLAVWKKRVRAAFIVQRRR